jgi:TrmH family RNA methyltransferase
MSSHLDWGSARLNLVKLRFPDCHLLQNKESWAWTALPLGSRRDFSPNEQRENVSSSATDLSIALPAGAASPDCFTRGCGRKAAHFLSRPARKITLLLLPDELDRLRVVLVATRNPLNLGAAARAMSNFGFLRLRVVNPYEVAFREARSAVGAPELLANAEEYKSLADAVADCTMVVGTTAVRHRDLQHPLRLLDEGAGLIREHLVSGATNAVSRVALLFGSEKRGLSNQDLSYCHWLLRIPTREEHISMNMGQAVAVCLYELVREGRTAESAEQPEKPDLATAGELERITALLLDALRTSGYLDSRSPVAAEEKIRRLVCRLNLPAADAEIWLGMLRQILWKLSGPGGAP